MNYTTSGKAPALKVRGTVEQTEVDEDFSTFVPVEVQLPGKQVITQWVHTASEPVSFNVDLKQAPVRVTLDPALAVKK